MNVLITGVSGFIGKNLKAHLEIDSNINVLEVTRCTDLTALEKLIDKSDIIVHLAGVNRPENVEEFLTGNVNLTRELCELATITGRILPIIFSSSTQVDTNTNYGKSKLQAEQYLQAYSDTTGSPVYIFRFPNVMGKWCRPNYNSVVATFCHNISHNLPIDIHNPDAEITLVYIDDIVKEFFRIIHIVPSILEKKSNLCSISPEFTITVGDLAEKIQKFKESRNTLLTERVGIGLDRALYATYLSYLDVADFSYPLIKHTDDRGVFVEVLKTMDSGQFSYLTAKPGITRGMHYHHTKSEKFLVVNGEAIFRYKKLYTDEIFEIRASGKNPEVIETIPGWVHDITNCGDEDLIVLLWANEIFSKDSPDTIASTF
jgi:UDP-2-acetamido-2,6-beta-L-arabino-hexul-4-ose reductase